MNPLGISQGGVQDVGRKICGMTAPPMDATTATQYFLRARPHDRPFEQIAPCR
jgi:hypothetical protein